MKRLREIYGKELLAIGGVNKIALIEGKAAVDRELNRLTEILQQRVIYQRLIIMFHRSFPSKLQVLSEKKKRMDR